MSDAWVSSSVPYLSPRGGGAGSAWASEASAHGARAGQRILSAGEIGAPSEVAAGLGLPEPATVIARCRVMYRDDTPCEVTVSHWPVDIAQGTGLARTGKIKGGALSLLAELGWTPARAVEEVSAELADAEMAEILGLGPGPHPVLRVVRTLLDADERPFQVDILTMPAALQRLRYEIGIR